MKVELLHIGIRRSYRRQPHTGYYQYLRIWDPECRRKPASGLVKADWRPHSSEFSHLLIMDPDSAPIRRLIRQAKEKGLAIDMTCGRKTKAAIFLDSGHIALVALQPETIVGRLGQQRERLGP